MMVRLATAFFCSGFGALLCRVVWRRMLGIFAGSDTVSAALVVGAFLTGLGVGSLIGAKVADRLPLGWWWSAGGGDRRRWRRVPPAELALAAALVAAPSNPAFWNRMHGRGPGAFAAWAQDHSGVAFFRRDAHEAAAAPPVGRLFIAGYAQGSTQFQPTHLLLGAAGPLLHPEPRRVLLVGVVGSGGTPCGALASPGVGELRAVEIVGPVLATLREVARREPDGTAAALLADPRARFEYGDGRRAVAGSGESYDVIEADAVRPETSHSGLLYSEEFFERVRRRLLPAGSACSGRRPGARWTPSPRCLRIR